MAHVRKPAGSPSAASAKSGAATSTATDAIDLEKAPIEQVLSNLNTDKDTGLTSAEAKARLSTYGANALEEKTESFAHKLLHAFMGPIEYMIEAAAIISAIIGHWDDFAIIVLLLVFNVTIDLWQSHKATSALDALKAGMAPQATVLRDGAQSTVDAATLVPGDIIQIKLGQIVPADVRLISGDYASIDQSALTGESIAATKKVGDEAYSGSVVKQGEMMAVVIATGAHTFFGRTAKLVAGAGAKSHAQQAMFQIGNYLIVVAVILAAIMVGFDVYTAVTAKRMDTQTALSILQFVLVLLVASIPVAMPTVFSITLALGALDLSKKKAIVSKLASIEEMAGIDILCSDKTGTLTKNQLTLGDTTLFHADDAQQVVLAGALASEAGSTDAIDTAVTGALANPDALKGWTVDKFVPFDPVSKRTEAQAHDAQGNKARFTKGAPQVIVDLAKPAAEEAARMAKLVDDLAAKGNRALGVARSDDDGTTWQIQGVFSLFDPPRNDSKATIEAAEAKGISVKMVTGDDTAIAIETCRQLGLGTNILDAGSIFPKDMDPDNVPAQIAETIEHADGFARVFPEHKYAIVKALQKRGHIVAMTGDGVNDAPALKQADCGTAVSGATDAARSAAALILTAPGLSVIKTAIDEARKIFERITSYTVYRVALTMTIMFLVVLSSIFLQFAPLTAIMIVIMSLLDDIPIMTIAYDNTHVSEKPVRWEMRKILTTSSVLGVCAVVQSMLLLVYGYLSVTGHTPNLFGIATTAQLQTVVFLQIVVGGHLLLFVTRQTKWFFQRPFPAKVLFWAIVATQVLAACMCFAGVLVPAIPLQAIGAVWAYDLAWMFVLSAVRQVLARVVR